MAVITTISLTENDAELLKELQKIDKRRYSATSLLRQALLNVRQELGIQAEGVKEKQRKIEILNQHNNNLREFIEKKGLQDEFLTEMGF